MFITLSACTCRPCTEDCQDSPRSEARSIAVVDVLTYATHSGLFALQWRSGTKFSSLLIMLSSVGPVPRIDEEAPEVEHEVLMPSRS